VIVIRHGQSEFNVRFAETRTDPGIEDPHLTDVGRQQIADGARFIQECYHERLSRILTSPYTRTLQSSEILAEILGLPIEITAEVGEHAHFACDVGTERSKLEQDWQHLNFGDLPEVWWPHREDEPEVDRRAMRFRARMAEDRLWRGTLLVTHWGFIRSLTGHRVPNAAVLEFDPTHPHPAGAEVVRSEHV